MGIGGAFLGGAVKGAAIGADLVNQYKRTKIAEGDADLRKQAAEREQTRYKREQDEYTKKENLAAEMSANVDKVFGPRQEATPETTETLTGPLDARDARAGTMDGVQTQVTTPAQEAKGGMEGINLMDPANHPKLMQLESLNMQSMIRTGQLKPEQIMQYRAYGQKMEKEGTATAFREFMAGNTSALDDVAKKMGVQSYSTEFVNQGGAPQLMFKMTKEDGTVQSLPASVFASSIGAYDMADSLHKQDTSASKAFQAQSDADYKNRSLKVQEERVGIEGKRADAAIETGKERVSAFRERTASRERTAAAKGEAGASYDPNLIPKMVGSTPPMLPQLGKPAFGAAAKPQKDQAAINSITSIANELYSTGADPVEAERVGRTAVENAGKAAMKELGEKGTTEQFIRRRDELLGEARKQLSKQQQPAATDSRPSLKPISPATQKARDTDRVGILRQERGALTSKLASATDATERSRLQADLEALDRELGGANKQASAIRTR